MMPVHTNMQMHSSEKYYWFIARLKEKFVFHEEIFQTVYSTWFEWYMIDKLRFIEEVYLPLN